MIKIENLNFGYSKKKILFEDLNHEFLPGHIYGLLGKNGAGKTTLLKQIAGLLFPQQGSCTVLGESTLTRKPSVLQDIYMIAEEFFLPSISIAQYVKINAPFYPHFDYDQFNQFLNEFELTITETLTSLSYGQKKKVLMGFGLAANTKLLILDEPTNGLDIPSKSQFRRIIASSLNEERCIIISTHQVRDLSPLMDMIMIMEKGKLIFSDSAELISRKLQFKDIRESEQNSHVLYEEKTGLSKKIIILNTSNSETEVDIELFFNGILSNTENIINALKN